MGEIGSGNGTGYPNALDTDTSIEVDSPSASATRARAAVPNDLAAAIIAVQTELGLLPKGAYATVRAKLDDMMALTGNQTVAGVKTLSSAPILSTLTGILKGNGASAVTIAAAGTDYAAATGLLGSTGGNTIRKFILKVSGSTGTTSTFQCANDTTASFNCSGVITNTVSTAIAAGGSNSQGTAGVDRVTWALDGTGAVLTMTFNNSFNAANKLVKVRANVIANNTGTAAVAQATSSGSANGAVAITFNNATTDATINMATLTAGKYIFAEVEIYDGGAA